MNTHPAPASSAPVPPVTTRPAPRATSTRVGAAMAASRAALALAAATALAAVSCGDTDSRASLEATNKWLVVNYYDAVFNRGDVAAAERALLPTYIQHNPGAPNGVQATKDGALGLRTAFPEARFEFIRTLAEGNLVAVHTRFTRQPGDAGQATFDIFRVEDGMIAEHWDALQAVTPSMSGNDMFSTLSPPAASEPDPEASRDTTRRVARAFYDRVFSKKDVTGFDSYASNYRQHNPLVLDGAEAAKAALGGFFQQFPETTVSVKRVIADGDMILFHANIIPQPGTLGSAVMDLFRVRDEKVVEHWDVVQEVPSSSANSNGVF